MQRLYELTKVLRSKNSGPFEITLDILFDNPQTYRRVVDRTWPPAPSATATYTARSSMRRLWILKFHKQ